MAWDTGLKEALITYGPSNVPFELLPDGVKVGPLFFPYPSGGSYSGMSLSPYGGLSNPQIMLLTVEQYTQGAMDYLNRIAGREAPSPRLLDNVILGNMADQRAPHPASQKVPIDIAAQVVDLHLPDTPDSIGSEIPLSQQGFWTSDGMWQPYLDSKNLRRERPYYGIPDGSPKHLELSARIPIQLTGERGVNIPIPISGVELNFSGLYGGLTHILVQSVRVPLNTFLDGIYGIGTGFQYLMRQRDRLDSPYTPNAIAAIRG